MAQRQEEAVAAAHGEPQRESAGLQVAPTEDGQGVAVVAVEAGSAAAGAGVRVGDIILAVNRVEVNDVASFVRETGKVKSGENIVLLLRRDDKTMYLAYKVL